MDLEQLYQPLERLSAFPTDPDAWESLYRALWPYLIGVFFRYFRANRQVAEDAAQEVMLRLLRYAEFSEKDRSPAVFLSYVNTVCRSVAADWYRREGSEPPAKEVTGLHLLDDAAVDPEAAQITRDLIEKVSDHLSVEDLQLAGSLIAGKSPSETAGELQINLSTYYQRVSRLRKRVRSILDALSEIA